jgi:acyl carrier protein
MSTISDPVSIVRNAIVACSLQTPDQDAIGEVPEISLSTKFEDLGFDSLAFMEFCISIFCEVGLDLTVERVAALGSPQAVVDLLKRER